MKKKYSIILVLAFSLLFLTQCSENRKQTALTFFTIPDDFVYDGCSLFPDGNYGDCCKIHDDAYFFGGTWKERLGADTELMSCVMKKEGFFYDILGPGMWLGVRIGGAPIWPTSFRWGFGRDRY